MKLRKSDLARAREHIAKSEQHQDAALALISAWIDESPEHTIRDAATQVGVSRQRLSGLLQHRRERA